MQEAVAGLDDGPERTRPHVVDRPLRPREERHLAGHAHEALGMLGDGREHRGRGIRVDTERLLGEEALACPDHIAVDLLVQVVPHRDVDDVDRVVCKEFGVVGGRRDHRVDLAEPLERGGVDVADGGEPWANRVIDEGRPALDGRRDLATHEAAADDGDVDAFDAHARVAHARSSSMIASASSTPAPPWSTASSAAVMPAGFSC